jgi:hypothetical protein
MARDLRAVLVACALLAGVACERARPTLVPVTVATPKVFAEPVSVAAAKTATDAAQQRGACLEACSRNWGLGVGLNDAYFTGKLSRELAKCGTGSGGEACRERVSRDNAAEAAAHGRENDHALLACFEACQVRSERGDRDEGVAPPGTVFCDAGLDCPPATQCAEYSCSRHGERRWCLRQARRSGEACSLPSGAPGICRVGTCYAESDAARACVAYAFRATAIQAGRSHGTVRQICEQADTTRESCEALYQGVARGQPLGMVSSMLECLSNLDRKDHPALPWGTWPTSYQRKKTP